MLSKCVYVILKTFQLPPLMLSFCRVMFRRDFRVALNTFILIFLQVICLPPQISDAFKAYIHTLYIRYNFLLFFSYFFRLLLHHHPLFHSMNFKLNVLNLSLFHHRIFYCVTISHSASQTLVIMLCCQNIIFNASDACDVANRLGGYVEIFLQRCEYNNLVVANQ